MATYVTWKPYYSVGEDSLDTQHKVIIGLINELYVSLAAGGENAKTKEILDQVVRYTFTHFEHEEQIMGECGYAELDAHKAVHDRMRQRTLDMRTNIDCVAGRDLLHFLKDWWTNHIQEKDKAYTPYLQVSVGAR